MLKWGRFVILQWPVRVPVKGGVPRLVLNNKLQRVKLCEEGLSRGETARKPGLLHRTAK